MARVKIFIVLMLLVVFVPVLAQAYTVSESGVGRDFSASAFNALSGSGFAGDTFYFDGTFTTMISVNITGTNGNPVTLDGYQAGDCDPLNSVCSLSVLLEQGMYVAPVSYLTIQDFRITVTGSGQTAGFVSYSNGINHFIFRRNFINNTSCRGFQIGDFIGSHSYNIIIEENKVTNFAMRNTAPGECTGLVLVNVDHTLVRNNIMGHDGGSVGCSTGCNTVTLHGCDDILFEYNDVSGAPQQAGIHPKESGSQNRHIYRFNKIHDNGGAGIAVGDGLPVHQYTYLYGNHIYSNGDMGIFPIRDFQDLYIWSNIISNNAHNGIAVYGLSGTGTNISIINNTIARNSTSDASPYSTGMSVYFGSGHVAKNNLLWNNRINGTSGLYNQILDTTSIVLEHNTLYHDSSTATWYYAGGTKSLAQMQVLNQEDDFPAGEVASVPFTDPAGADLTHGTADDDFTLSSDTLTAGADLSQCFSQAVDLSGGDSWMETESGYGRYIEPCLDDALDPNNTDWTTTPPTVGIVKRDVVGWTRGAYAYPSEFTISDMSPADDATGVSLVADLGWTNPSGTTETIVFFDTTDGTTQVSSGSIATSYDPGNLVGGTEYFWKVNIVHAGGTQVGTVYSFETLPATTPLTVHPTNNRWFQNDSGDTIRLGGHQIFGDLLDHLFGIPYGYGYNAELDWDWYLTFAEARNLNYVRNWSQFATGPTSSSYLTTPMPWNRTGPGTAYDGFAKFDLSSLNQDYFDRLYTRAKAAQDAGVYMSVLLFEYFAFSTSYNNWPKNVWNTNNNVNGVNAPTATFFTTTDATIVGFQENFVRKVLDTLNTLDNVIYEIANEAPYLAFLEKWAAFVTAYDATLTKQHLVYVSGDYSTTVSQLMASGADVYAVGANAGDYSSNPPIRSDTMPVIWDLDHTGDSRDNPHRKYAWMGFTRGYNYSLYDRPFEDPASESATWENIRYNIGQTNTYATTMDLASMDPSASSAVCSTTYCLVNAGEEYLFYQAGTGSFTAAIEAGNYTYEWYNPSTGAIDSTGSVTYTPTGTKTLTPPFAGDAVLYLVTENVESISNFTPVDSATDQDADVNLAWTNPGATTETVIFFDTTDGTTQVSSGSIETSYEPGTLAYSTEYFWKVNIVTAGGTYVGTTYSFTTAAGPLYYITDPSPADDAEGISVDTIISWTNTGTPTETEMYFDAVDGTTAVDWGTVETSYDPGTLDFSTEYFWRVDITDINGTTTGVTYSFITTVEALFPTAGEVIYSPYGVTGSSGSGFDVRVRHRE